jgi:predicted transcriptional regulator
MHTTATGDKIKTLQKEAQELARKAKAAKRAAITLPEATEKALELQREADKARAEALALKSLARLEDLTLWQMVKTKDTKKGSRKYIYWMATWRENGKIRNVHIGSCEKMDKETARQKAKTMKAEALAIKL